MDKDLKKQIIDLINENGAVTISGDDNSFSFADSLEHFVEYSFSEDEACEHWKGILSRHSDLQSILNRDVSIFVSITDYFTSDKQVFDSPVLVEVKVLKEAEEAAMQDSLTGAFNRRYMDIFLKKEVNRCNRYNKSFSIMLLDVDDFKKLNDRFGHVAGDDVLAEISEIMRHTIREEDVLCRYGGEEFLIIMPETTKEKASALYDRIQKKIISSKLYSIYNVTLSAGAANYMGNASNLMDLIRFADKCLYEAKRNGKNRLVVK